MSLLITIIEDAEDLIKTAKKLGEASRIDE